MGSRSARAGATLMTLLSPGRGAFARAWIEPTKRNDASGTNMKGRRLQIVRRRGELSRREVWQQSCRSHERKHLWTSYSCSLFVIMAICLTAGLASATAEQAPPASSTSVSVSTSTPSWPRVFDRNGTHVVIYQPQLKAWQKYRTLVADTAMSITDMGQKPVLGVISWRAETITDSSERIVYVSHIEVLDARFPSLDAAQAAAMQRRVHQIYPTVTLTIGLPSMIA